MCVLLTVNPSYAAARCDFQYVTCPLAVRLFRADIHRRLCCEAFTLQYFCGVFRATAGSSSRAVKSSVPTTPQKSLFGVLFFPESTVAVVAMAVIAAAVKVAVVL